MEAEVHWNMSREYIDYMHADVFKKVAAFIADSSSEENLFCWLEEWWGLMIAESWDDALEVPKFTEE